MASKDLIIHERHRVFITARRWIALL